MRFSLLRRQPSDAPTDWILVGLGNPGAQYHGTRHNVGFQVVDRLVEAHRLRLRREGQAQVAQGELGGASVLVLKPLTFMNLSGRAVGPVARRLSVPPERILVVFDDMDLPIGKLRIRPHGGAGGHGGIRSLIDSLQSQQFPRIRIGVGRPSAEGAVDHVLGKFTREELPVIQDSVEKAAQAVESIFADGLDMAMNRFNPSA